MSFTPTKAVAPGASKKSLFLTSALATLSLMACWSFTHRWASVQLSAPISPPGWKINFSTPEGWEALSPDEIRGGVQLRYSSSGTPHRSMGIAKLSFNTPVDLKKECRNYLSQLLFGSHVPDVQLQKYADVDSVALGDLHGFRCRATAAGTIIWAGSPDGNRTREVYLLQYQFTPKELIDNPELLRFFADECQAIARSIHFNR